MEVYKTVEFKAEDEFIERKSRFIGAICPVTTEDQAQAFVNERKNEHWDATHNCWAYIVRDTNAQRYSDDGEPQGTAGIPILEIMRKEEIFNAAIVVTRYFGGTMLGAGGLIRAYSHGAKIALEAGHIITMAECDIIGITLPYPIYDRFISATESYPMLILDTEYTDNVSLKIRLRKDYMEKMTKTVTELTSGSVEIDILGEEFAPI